MLLINRREYRKICDHMRIKAPYEGCGILGGTFLAGDDTRRIEKFFPVENTEKDPEKFIMDSSEQLSVMKTLRAQSLDMVGICHSHPHSEAYPSRHDVSLAAYEEVSYVIISLASAGEPAVKSFRIIKGEIIPEPIEIN